MSDVQDFCLRWSSYTQQLSEALRTLLDRELLVDVTLACDGRSLRAHRAILSACSSYFQDLFQESTHPHPIVILKDVRYHELEALVKFMYHGEVTVNHDTLPGFLRTAETLHVRGLTDNALSGSTSTPNSFKVDNGNQRSLDDDESFTGQEGNSTTAQRLSPVLMKRIKLEMPSTSQYQHSVGLPHSDPHCPIGSDDMPAHLNQEQYNVPRSVTTLDGLSQLVMPVLHEDTSHSSHFVGANIQNQHHQVPQQQQPISHQATQHSTNNSNTTSSGASRPFRQRVLYNQEQLLQLEAWYRQDRYPSGAHMHEYADTLAAMVPNTPGSIGAQPMRQNVDYWFQNRRRKDFHPEVMQQREKKKLAKTLWGNYNGNNGNTPTTSGDGTNSLSEHNGSASSR
ncbi:zinc finger and BTB domain-containing protein 18.2-like isoform X2 [Thrips palmi]|uniref:Zinc finger and BTB domain-containing protein 18.2-like isoform X2 n=1 Tax=Thrips palmi TaxID=161013 RepID=A0A6P8Z0E4_THRPL|nr:zinc finger and BTB domain-containing protein 18.2-like isoform X2 [Thrips palmi]